MQTRGLDAPLELRPSSLGRAPARNGRLFRLRELGCGLVKRVCLLTVVLLTCSFRESSGAEVFETTEVFTGGVGYDTYYVPSIATAPDGTLIAIAEGRSSEADPLNSDIDLVMKRSFDGGATWSPLVVVDDPTAVPGWGADSAASNPTMVVDQGANKVWLFYNRWKPGFDTQNTHPGMDENTAWVRSSGDNGATWSAPIDVTHAVTDYDNWGAMFFAPGSGIQTITSSKPNAGRLLVPAAYKPGGPEIGLNSMRPYAIYSDDHGATWNRAPGDLNAVANENQLVELENGDILMDARQRGSSLNRWKATSSDEGLTWSAPIPGESITPVATAIERLTLQSAGDDKNRILWTGPGDPNKREKLQVKVSYNEGQTFPRPRTITFGSGEYSDMTVFSTPAEGQLAGVLWANKTSSYSIQFTRFNLEWLEQPHPGAPAPISAYDSFEYPTGRLGVANGGAGWNSRWSQYEDLASGSNADVRAGSLQYAGLPYATSGNRVQVVGSQSENLSRSLTQPIDLDANQTYYASLLIERKSDAPGVEYLDIGLWAEALQEIKFGADDSGHFQLDTLGDSVTGSDVALDTVYLLAMKIEATEGDWAADNFDRISMSVFQSGDLIPSADNFTWDLVGTDNENSMATIDRMRISAGPSSSGWFIDELRLGTSWEEVFLNNPPPTTVLAWNKNGSGSWSDASNWSPGIVPNANTVTAVFGSTVSSPRTVALDSSATVKSIRFDIAYGYSVAGPGALNLEADTGNASIEVVRGSHQFQVAVTLHNPTDLDVAAGASLAFNNTLDLNGHDLNKTGGGVLQVNNTLSTGGGMVIVSAGGVSGSGMIDGDLSNPGGAVSPGNSPGVLTIVGDYTQAVDGVLSIEIGGQAQGRDFDLFDVEGRMTIDGGTLDVLLLNGFEPSAGDLFDILNFRQFLGKGFDTLNFDRLAGRLAWDTSRLYVDGTLSIVAVPEPSIGLLALAALFGGAAIRGIHSRRRTT